MHLLLDDMDYLDRNITVMMEDLESVSVGVRTVRRLEDIKNAVRELGVSCLPHLGELIHVYVINLVP